MLRAWLCGILSGVLQVIETQRIINVFPQNSESLFKDILIPISSRNGFVKSGSLTIPIYSYRYIGIGSDRDQYYQELHKLDKNLSAFGDMYLKITSNINILPESELVSSTQHLWENIVGEGRIIASRFRDLGVFPKLNSSIVNSSIEESFSIIFDLYKRNSPNVNPTVVKNFSLKLATWINSFVPKLFRACDLENNSVSELHNPKVVYYGDAKEHEVYFLILLSLLGCDVVYINTLSEGKYEEVDRRNEFSRIKRLPERDSLREFPHYQEPVRAEPIVLRDPVARSVRSEKTFEELAQLSNSTVMVRTYNRAGEIIGTGSGVIIDKRGLIVTNYHVIEGGFYYGVVFEGPEEGHQYETFTIMNADVRRDLAFIKIHLDTVPIEIDNMNDLIRGQKVVAIGSPLGLMNTVSDGIISGFRKAGVHDYIQTTAPISPGSSGGALLNMYGELIGITSAGYIDGQNINLAIPSKDIVKMLEEKATVMNMEIIYNYHCFSYGNAKVVFDGFFRYSLDSYKVGLYQSRQDKSDFGYLTSDQRFKEALERYYIENIMKVAERHGIGRYDFEVGGNNHIFSYSYDRGRINRKGWGPML